MKHFLLIVGLATLIGGLAVLPAQAQAEQPAIIETLLVRIWPEFDQPSALVFLTGQVAEGTPLPVEVRFELPAGASPSAVAYADSVTGDLYNATFRFENSVLTVDSPNGSFHVEFYEPISRDGQARNYTLALTMQHPVNQLVWEVQQPLGSQGFTLEPVAETVASDEYSLPSHRGSQQNVAAGRTITVSVRYTKPDDTLSAERLASQGVIAPQTTVETGAEATTQTTIVFLVLIGVVLAVLIGGVIYFNRRGGLPQAARRPRRKGAAPKANSRSRAGKRFCTQCGQPVGAGDRFCRHCGAELR